MSALLVYKVMTPYGSFRAGELSTCHSAPLSFMIVTSLLYCLSPFFLIQGLLSGCFTTPFDACSNNASDPDP